MTNFYDSQAICEFTFSKLCPCWHMFTPENCPIIFTTVEDYKVGVSLFGIAALICRNVKVITFELMSNHIHATICGSEEDIREFFRLFRSLLNKYFKGMGRGSLPELFECSLRVIETLDDMRNVVVYNNRNGYLVHPEHSPFSYPFGANSYFFNPSAKDYYISARTKIKTKDLEKLAHTHAVRDIQNDIYVVNGYISPLGQEYADYNLLQLIRKSKAKNYKCNEVISSYDLFSQGDSFEISKYKDQFVNCTKTNAKYDFPWSFTIKSLNSGSAKIKIEKEGLF